MKLSIVVPCYNEEKVLPLFYEEISKELKKLDVDYELVFVDDGSRDRTIEELRNKAHKNKRIKVISFSRNFGKESAMLAGLDHTKGDYVVIMDADLQDPPYMLESMLKFLETNDYDCVATYRVTRKGEPPIRSFFARMFYKLINKFTKVEIVDGARDYRMMTRQMVDSLLELREYHRFSKGLFTWIGFKTKYLDYENVERRAGETKWNFWKLTKYAIEGIVSFTTAPLRLATIFGLGISLIAFLYLIYIIINTLIFGNPTAGWPSMTCIILFLGGIQLITIGIIGEYLARTYEESKKRPSYIISEYINNDK
jgi:glycosyltransferase involved in cell wall biosynthesis